MPSDRVGPSRNAHSLSCRGYGIPAPGGSDTRPTSNGWPIHIIRAEEVPQVLRARRRWSEATTGAEEAEIGSTRQGENATGGGGQRATGLLDPSLWGFCCSCPERLETELERPGALVCQFSPPGNTPGRQVKRCIQRHCPWLRREAARRRIAAPTGYYAEALHFPSTARTGRQSSSLLASSLLCVKTTPAQPHIRLLGGERQPPALLPHPGRCCLPA